MNLLFVQENIIQALCRTLLHSLWQGLLAAAIAGVIIMLTNKSKAVFRYNLLSLVFISFIIATCITFSDQLHLLNQQIISREIAYVPDTESQTVRIVTQEWLPAFNKDIFYQSVINSADRYSSFIIAIWLLFFCIHLLRMFVGLHYAYRIRFYKTTIAGDNWRQRLNQMSARLGISGHISLMESAVIKVPVVTGFIKPMVLVPIGMFANLPAEQVEAILLHELAHIRRKDFLMNVLQRLAESLFFFNPFIAWLSARIREEREACCDDIVMEYTTDKRSYFEALISFREAGIGNYSPARSLGRNNKLLYRVKRMITQENKKLNAMEKLTLILILTAATAVSFIPAGKSERKQKSINNLQGSTAPREKKTVASFAAGNELQQSIVPSDTLPGKKTITFSNISSVNNDDGEKRSSAVTAKASNDKTYSYRIENDELTDLAIDGVKIKKEDFHLYKPVIDQIERARADRERNILLNQKIEAEELMNKQYLLNQKLIEQQKNYDKSVLLKEQNELLNDKLMMLELQNNNKQLALNDIRLRQADIDKKMLLLFKERSRLQYGEKNATDLKEQAKNLLRNVQQNDELKSLNEKLEQEKSELYMLRDKERQELFEKKNKQELLANQLYLKKNELLLAQDQQFHNSNHELASILSDLAEANVIDDKNNFSFSLDDKELIVDGKKQSGSLHEMLRKKYIRHKKDYYRYKAKPNSRSTDVYVE